MKSINKALIYRDLKYSKWFIPILSIVLLWLNIPSYLNLGNWMKYERYTRLPLNGVGTDAGIIGTFILAVVLQIMVCGLFYFDRNPSSYSFAASMPFKKKEIIISKWIIGLFNIFVAYFILYVMMNLLLIINNCWTEGFWLTTISFIVNLLLSLCIYGFILMIQAINGSVFVGGLLSLLFALIPYTFVYYLNNMYSYYHNMGLEMVFINNTYSSVMDSLDFLKSLLGMDVSVDLYMPYWVLAKIIIYLAALIVMYFLSIRIFNKSKMELTGKLITVKSMNTLYKIVMAYYAGVLAHSIIYSDYSYDAFRIEYIFFTLVIIPIPFYFLIGKVIKIYNHRYA